MSEQQNEVWSSDVDGGAYHAFVVRTGEYRGTLIVVAAGGHELMREDVGLAYGARFGPDVDDVAMWQELVTTWIDGQ